MKLLLVWFVLLCRSFSDSHVVRRQLYTFNGPNLEAFQQDSYQPGPPPVVAVNDGQPHVEYGSPGHVAQPHPQPTYGPPAPPPSSAEPPPTLTEFAPQPPQPPVNYVPPPPLDGAGPTASYGAPPLADDGAQPPPAGHPGGYSDSGQGNQQYGPPKGHCGHCGGKVTFSQLIQSYADVVNAKINKIFGIIQQKIKLFQGVLEGVHQAVHVPGTDH